MLRVNDIYYTQEETKGLIEFGLKNITLWVYMAFALLAPAVMMATQHGNSTANTMMVITGAVGFIAFLAGVRDFQKQNLKIILAFLVYFLMIAINKFIHGDSADTLRVIAVMTLIYVLVPNKKSVAMTFWLGTVVASIAMGALSINEYMETKQRVYGFTNAILFGQAALILLTVNLVALHNTHKIWLKLFVLLALAANLVAIYLSQTRGVWLALIVVSAFYFFHLLRKYAFRATILMLLTCFVAGVFLVKDEVFLERVNQGKRDLQLLSAENYDSSWGLRVVAWKSAWLAFKEHPIIGVGSDNFAQVKKQQYKDGLMPEVIVKRWLYHAHNQYLQNMMLRGIIGLVSLLIVLGVPLFVLGAQHSVLPFAYLLPLAIILCGLTDVPLEHRNVLFLYTYFTYGLVTIAWNKKDPEKRLNA